MKSLVKNRANRAYGWMEDNPVTTALVSGGSAAILAVALTVAFGLYASQTFVTQSACSRDATSAECAKLRQEVARAEPIENPCISHQRVEGTKGRNCPRFFIAHNVEATGGSTIPDAGSGGGRSVPQTSSVSNPAADGTGAGDKGKGVVRAPHAVEEGGEGGGQGTPTSNSPAGLPTRTEAAQGKGGGTESQTQAEAPKPKPILEAAGAVLEDAGQTVNEAGAGTTKTVEGVGRGVSCALNPNC